MQMQKKIRQVFSWICIALVLLLSGTALYTVIQKSVLHRPVAWIGKYTTALVASGSMSPAIQVNDVIVVRQESHYAVGDIIMYASGSSTVTHRIEQESKEGFITKGDANTVTDTEPVAHAAVCGKVICILPKLGYLVQFFKSRTGVVSILLIGILGILLQAHTTRI